MSGIHIPYNEDDVLEEHTDTEVFCGDMGCPCHEDQENTGLVGEYYTDGLMTADEADQYYQGKTI